MPEYNCMLTLTPLSQFFFGGEGFSAREEKAFYLQKSNAFPQQTALLGLIRYQLLQQTGAPIWDRLRSRINDQAKAALIIGARSFDPDEDPAKGIQTFGKIEALSPVYLVNGEGKQFLPYPKVSQWGEQEKTFRDPQRSTSQVGRRLLTGEPVQNPLPTFDGYDPKLGFEWGFKALKDPQWLKYSDVYEEMDAQVGINKPHTLPHRREETQAEQEGFFKMTYCRFKSGFSFGVDVRLEKGAGLKTQPMVNLGKEQSAFRMKVSLPGQPSFWQEPIPELLPGQCLWLTAPSKVDASIIHRCCSGMIGRQASFRSMVSEVKEAYNYFGNPRMKHRKQQPIISGRYNLLDRGTMLWLREDLDTADIQAFRQAFSDLAFQSIGYNHLITL